MGNCLTSAQPRATVQDLACSSELAKPRVAAVLDLSQPRERPVCLDLGGGKFSRVGSGAFSSGLSFHPGGFSLVSGFRALLPGQSSCAAARVVRSVSPLLGPLRVPTGSVGVVGCVPGPVAPHVVPAVVSAGPLGIPARYASAMAEIEETISHAWDPATVKRREKLMFELAGWLGESGLGCSLADCSPNHLLLFFKLHWLLAHRGTRLRDGRMVAAWSSLSCAVSHVSTGLRQRGRVLVWDEVTCPLGNPAVTFRVRKWVSGYSEELWRAGYREGSAVPMSPAKLVSLLSYLDTQSTRTRISGLDMPPFGMPCATSTAGVAPCVVRRPASWSCLTCTVTVMGRCLLTSLCLWCCLLTPCSWSAATAPRPCGASSVTLCSSPAGVPTPWTLWPA